MGKGGTREKEVSYYHSTLSLSKFMIQVYIIVRLHSCADLSPLTSVITARLFLCRVPPSSPSLSFNRGPAMMPHLRSVIMHPKCASIAERKKRTSLCIRNLSSSLNIFLLKISVTLFREKFLDKKWRKIFINVRFCESEEDIPLMTRCFCDFTINKRISMSEWTQACLVACTNVTAIA